MDKVHILLVEDDPDDVFFLETAMEKAAPGRVVLEVARDADEAERMLSAYEAQGRSAAVPRLIIMDHRLPARSGYDVLEWIRARPALAHLPVVIFSGYTDQDEVARAHAFGANSYLPKDMDTERLERVAAGLVAYAELVAGSREAGAQGDPADPVAAALKQPGENG